MKRAVTTIPPEDERLRDGAPTITLARDARYRRRITWTTDNGMPFLLDLADATYLPDGSGLELEDGSVIIVRAKPEELLEITADTPQSLHRITWHIGNRHTPAEIAADALYILPDHVLAEMVRGLGGIVTTVTRPFEPEGGAYGGHGTLERGHHHHSHDHDHS